MMRFASAFDGLNEERSIDSGLECLDDSRTVQSQSNDADINVIVKRFKLTGELPRPLPRIPLEADFREEGEFDLGAAIRFVRDSESVFMAFPAEIRARFGNDPIMLSEFLSNPDNKDEAIRLGILAKPVVIPEPEPMRVRVIAEEPQATK